MTTNQQTQSPSNTLIVSTLGETKKERQYAEAEQCLGPAQQALKVLKSKDSKPQK